MTPAPADAPGPRRLVGRYRLEHELGRGAMGTVWSAYDEVLHRAVAVKEVRLSSVPVNERGIVRERTLREARATAMLSHPNVVTLYDVVEVNSEPYVVMELLPSRSLASYIGERGTLTQPEAAEIGSAVASALTTAHRAGITHRDVKPGNVLIGENGQIKLTDFGIARNAAEQSMTQTGTVLGSPPYIAPEVAMGRAVGPAADLWGLGATLFACLEGRPPYDAGDPVGTVTEVVHGDVPVPTGRGPVVDVIRGLMVKDPALRMPLAAVRRRLRPLLSDPEGPVLAAPSAPRTAAFRVPRAGEVSDQAGIMPVPASSSRGPAGTLVEGSPDAPGEVPPSPRPTPDAKPSPTPRSGTEAASGPAGAVDGDAAVDRAGVADPPQEAPEKKEQGRGRLGRAGGRRRGGGGGRGGGGECRRRGRRQREGRGAGRGRGGRGVRRVRARGKDDATPAEASEASEVGASEDAEVESDAEASEGRGRRGHPARHRGGHGQGGRAGRGGVHRGEDRGEDRGRGADAAAVEGADTPETAGAAADDAAPASTDTEAPEAEPAEKTTGADKADDDASPAAVADGEDAEAKGPAEAPPEKSGKSRGHVGREGRARAAEKPAEKPADKPADKPAEKPAPATPGNGQARPAAARAAVSAPGDAETTMVGPRVPRSEDVTRAVRRPPAPPPRTVGPPTPGRWTPPGGAPAPGWRPPPQRPAAAAPGGPSATGQRLAADPGPLPFTPSARPTPAPRRSPWAVAGVVALLVLMAALGAVGAYALTRSLAGQGALSTDLTPAGPEVAGTVLVAHADTDQRYAGTGLDFSALVPAGWQQFRLEQPGGDVTVRFVSPDAGRELRIDRVTGFYPSQRAADYVALLSRPDSLGVDGSSVGPVETVGAGTPGGESPQQTVYRTTSGPTDDRTTWTRLVPSGTSLWVIRLTATSTDVVGAPDQFQAVADSFAAPPP